MSILRTALFAAAACLALAPRVSAAHIGGGGMHSGGGHFAGHVGGVHPGFVGGQHGGFHGGGGRFVHGFHGGRAGVFFVVGGLWYPWPAYYGYPAYAYPAYAGTWWWCQSASAYYPYVTWCPEGWMQVTPAAPAY